MSKPTLTDEDMTRTAALLQCEVAAVRAVTKKEVSKAGFLPDGQPAILFERHIFHRLTGGRFDGSHPHLSNRKAGGYGAAGKHQHDRLAAAAKLDRDAALQAASWGCFQILGRNWAQCGFPSLQAFINAMYRSESEHIDAFARFVLGERRVYPFSGPHRGMSMLTALRTKTWQVFAYLYNGPKYRVNNYDAGLKRHYDEAPAGEKRIPGAMHDLKGGA